MSRKWTKILVCEGCKGTLFECEKWRWDGYLDGKTYTQETCIICEGTDVKWYKTDNIPKRTELPELANAQTITRKFLESVFPDDVAWEICTKINATLNRRQGLPYYTGRWNEGMCVPMPKGGYQNTGLSYEQFEESEWRADFTGEEYIEWRKKNCKDGGD